MMRYIVPLLAFAALSPTVFAHESALTGTCHRGAYAMSDGSNLLIQPSDGDNLRYRFLTGVSGKLFPISGGQYESGEGWSVREPVAVRVSFGSCDQGIMRFQREKASELKGNRVALPTTAIYFESGDVTLYGELVMPAKHKPRAVVVLQYGGGRDSAVTDNFVQHLLPLKDIAVFVFDKRGTGRSSGAFSAHIGMLSDDLVAAIRSVRARAGMKDVPLGVMGESQGGWVAPLAATKTPVDFVVVSYGLAVSMLEEDREEVAQALRAKGYGADVLAMGDAIHDAAALVVLSRFSKGLDELEQLKSRWRDQPWFADLSGDFTAPLSSTPKEKMPDVQAAFNFPYDLAYDPMPTLGRIDVPLLWILAGEDTEAPHKTTLANLQQLKSKGLPVEVVVFPNAEHGMIAVEHGPEGPRLAGRTVDGYFELLADWIIDRGSAIAGRTHPRP